MESSVKKVSRLVEVLEQLFDQASCSVNAKDYPGALVIRERCQPVIDEICRLMVEPGLADAIEPSTRERLNQLLKKQFAHLERISVDKSVVNEELHALQVAHSQMQRFRSAYGSSAGAHSLSNYAETG